MTTERIPPCNVEAEACVIASMVLDAGARGKVLALLKPTDFFRPGHAVAFTALAALDAAGRPVDLVTLRGELEAREQLEAALKKCPMKSIIYLGKPSPKDLAAVADKEPAQPVQADRGSYLTRNELVAYTQELVRVMGTDLTDYDRRRSGETVYMIREAFDELARRQQQDYERLDARIRLIERGLEGLAVTPAAGAPAAEPNP